MYRNRVKPYETFSTWNKTQIQYEIIASACSRTCDLSENMHIFRKKNIRKHSVRRPPLCSTNNHRTSIIRLFIRCIIFYTSNYSNCFSYPESDRIRIGAVRLTLSKSPPSVPIRDRGTYTKIIFILYTYLSAYIYIYMYINMHIRTRALRNVIPFNPRGGDSLCSVMIRTRI